MLNIQTAYNTDIKQWVHYLRSLEAQVVINSVTNHSNSYMEVVISILSMMSRGFAVICPNIHYSYLTKSSTMTQSLCGRIDILANGVKNTEDLQTIYTIMVPGKFNINFSLVDFSEDFEHPSYTGCGFNDILIYLQRTRPGRPSVVNPSHRL